MCRHSEQRNNTDADHVEPSDVPDELEHALREKESLRAEIDLLKRELTRAWAERDALRRSLSWTITAPLRGVADMLLRTTGRSPRRASPHGFPEPRSPYGPLGTCLSRTQIMNNGPHCMEISARAAAIRFKLASKPCRSAR